MRSELLDILRSPGTGEPLALHAFERRDGEVAEGILAGRDARELYPVMQGVPVMLDAAFTGPFLQRHAAQISKDSQLRSAGLRPSSDSRWSFSEEWHYHQEANLDKTWQWTVEQRVRQFLLETNLDVADLRGKRILDAGCGNGQLSMALGALGATVIAIDYSTSVFAAERSRTTADTHFLQGDLRTPPFALETFDVVISNGVIHHTPSTYDTFVSVAKLVKPGGRFYLWLYRKPGSFLKHYVSSAVVDGMRTVVSRLPRAPQAAAVHAYAAAELVAHKLLRRNDGSYSWHERIVDAYDSITPRWRHYHTPLQVSCWFFENGFSRPTITHWDNPYGFGMVATKCGQPDTPGVNFGKRYVATRYWV